MEICPYMSNMIQAWKLQSKIGVGGPCRAECTVRHVIQGMRVHGISLRAQNERFYNFLIMTSNKAARAVSVLQIWLHGRLLNILAIQQVLRKASTCPNMP